MWEAARAQIIDRCISVIHQHKNSGPSLGPIKKWLDAILDDKAKEKELRGLVKDNVKDNALGLRACGTLLGACRRPMEAQLGKG